MTPIVWTLAVAGVIWGGSVVALLGIAFVQTLGERHKGAMREPDLIHASASRFSRSGTSR